MFPTQLPQGYCKLSYGCIAPTIALVARGLLLRCAPVNPGRGERPNYQTQLKMARLV